MKAGEDRRKAGPEGGAGLPDHIDWELFCGWQEGRLMPEEENAFLGHIGACTFCAERFGDWMEASSDTPPAPRYLKEEILSRAGQLDIQAARKLKETSRQAQLLLYSMKVGFAVALSIFLLVLTTSLQNMDLQADKSQPAQEWGVEAQQEQGWGGKAQGRGEDGTQRGSLVESLRQGSHQITGALKDLSNGLFRIGTENESNQEVTR